MKRITKALVPPVEVQNPGSWPGLAELLRPREPFLIPLLLLFAGRAMAWAAIPLASEDAYITFRYARHLATGNGLVYNPGEAVFGFSSPLWTFWNALGFAWTRDPLLWSRLSGIIADAATLVALGALIRRHASRASAWVFTFAIAAWPTFSAVAVSGMETGALLASIAVAALIVESKHVLSGPALAVVGLMRPEGLVAAAIVSLGARWRDRWVALFLVGAGLAWLFFQFGTVVPQSVIAKSAIYGTAGPLGGRHWWDWLVPIVLGRLPTIGETRLLSVLTVLLAPAFVMGLPGLWKARSTGMFLAIAACLAVWIGYALVGVAYFWWYVAVPLGGVAAVVALGFPRVVRGRAIAISAVLLTTSLWSLAWQLYRGRAHDEAMHFGRAADVLRGLCRPGDSVMLEPIGLVGYTNPVRVIDEVGLVSPEVAARRLRGPGWYTDIAAQKRPDWLILRAGTLRTTEAFAGAGAPFRSTAERDSLLTRYQVVDRGDQASGDRALWVLRRLR